PGTSPHTHNIWGHFMKNALHGTSILHPRPPEGVAKVKIDPQTGEKATAACPNTKEVWFLSGTEPTQICKRHRETAPHVPSKEPSLWERIKKWWSG
ncbi:MAG: monofunctional biosynthetic peptidoglycan transglycosylase, partial [Firmicutes bacterium]|nr:monofunctional biosynthetic peptidoglycan transglycosylase [Bacillota bacterium]